MPGFMQTLAGELGVSVDSLEAALMRVLLGWAFEQDQIRSFRENNKPLVFADLYLDPAARVVRRGERFIKLDRTEFELLAFLMRHPRQVLPHDLVISTFWGYDGKGDTNTLRAYIGALRTKLGEPRLIQTERGVGYVLRED